MDLRLRFLFSIFLPVTLVLAASACGSSVSGPSGYNSPAPQTSSTAQVTPTITPTSSPYPTPSVAIVRGRVVDFSTNEALPHVIVAIASPGDVPSPVTSTAPDGSFTFLLRSGDYDLQIGNNESLPTDGRATVHMAVRLIEGSNVITAPLPRAVPDVSPAPSQLTGDLRLAVLSVDEKNCLIGMNDGRATAGLHPVIPDEYSLETARAWVSEETAQGTDTPVPLWGADYDYVALFSGLGATTAVAQPGSSCSGWTDGYSFSRGNPPYQWATDPLVKYYGASWASAPNGTMYGMQTWGE